MGKGFKSQASSSRAISGAFSTPDGPPASFGGGFGAVPASPLSYVYEPPDLSNISEPNIVVAFKNLQKKDSTTKAKALEDLQRYVSAAEPPRGVEDAVVEPWIKVYPRTSIDTSRRVRQLAHLLQGAIAHTSGRKFAKFMPDIVGPWLAGIFDGDKMVSNAAKDSLKQVFSTEEKLKNVWRAYLGSILQYCSDAILKETVNSLSDERTVSPDDALAKQARVVASAIHVVRHAIENTSQDALDKNQDTLNNLLQRKELWKLSSHSDPAVRRAVYRLLDTSLQNNSQVLEVDTISSCLLLSSLHISQASSAADYTSVLVHLTKHEPCVWTEFYKGTGKKSAQRRLSQFLSKGSQGGASSYWDQINALLLHIPQPVLLSSEDTADHALVILEALRDGVTNREEPRSNQSAAWNAYLNLVKRFLTFPGIDHDQLIGQTAIPILTQYITPSSETSSWTIAASQQSIVVDAAQVVLSSPQPFTDWWRKMSETLIQDIRTSMPEQSKDFAKSQDAIAAKANRWYRLQGALSSINMPQGIRSAMTDATESEIDSAVSLLKSRNGKPYGAAYVISYAVRFLPNLLSNSGGLKTLITAFLTNDLPNLLFSPSGPIFIELLPALQSMLDVDQLYRISLISVLKAPESPASFIALQFLVSSPCLARLKEHPELLASLILRLQEAVGSGDKQTEILKLAIANRDAPGEMNQSILGRLLDEMLIEERQSASLNGLEIIATHNRDAIKAYDASTEGSTLLTKLISLAEAPDNTIARRAESLKSNIQAIISAGPVEAYHTRLQIVRWNLDRVDDDALPITSLNSLMNETLGLEVDQQARSAMAEEMLPDEARWLEALRPVCSAMPNPSLAIMNHLGTAVSLLDPSASPVAISFDKDGFSAAFRLFWFTYALIASCNVLEYATAERRTCTLSHLLLVSAMASDQLSIEFSQTLWNGHGPGPDDEIPNVIMEVQKLLGSLLAESPVNASIESVLTKLLEDSRAMTARAYYSSRAYVAVATELESRHSNSEISVPIEDRKSVKNTTHVFAGIATLSALLDSTILARMFNELLATLTERNLMQYPSALPNMIMLNNILATEDFADALLGIPKQRLIFFVQHLCAQFISIRRPSEVDTTTIKITLSFEAEMMRALSQVLPVLRETYGSFWEDNVQILKATWSFQAGISDQMLPVIHASLRLYSTLLRLGADDSNDDLVDALKSHEVSAADGVVNILRALQDLPDDLHAPRKMVNELLGRLIANVKGAINPTRFPELFPILASESIALQGAAHDILHSQIPKEQENLSLDKALSKDYVARLPEELLSLIIEAPTQEQLADASFQRSMPPFLQGYTLSWSLIFDHWDGASDAVKNDYVASLKEGSYLNGLLGLASGFLITSRARPVDASKFEIDTYRPGEDPPEKDAQWLLIHLYYLALKHLPTLSKTWWRDNTSRQTQMSVESWTEKYISPHIITSELQAVSAWTSAREADADQPLTVKTSISTREVTASIPIDEQSMSITISLPTSYPLSRATVSGLHRVGVTEQKWRSWIITTQGVINFSDIGGGGQALIDGLTAWRRNVTATLKGQTECAICYSVVSADRQLPSKRCGTCKNLFHGSCLFKWFKSSNSSSCPLCRNQFSYA